MRKVFPSSSRIKRVLIVSGLVILALYLLRYPILKGVGSFLCSCDQDSNVDVLFVLGGSPTDRGPKAAELWHAGKVNESIYCTGGYDIPALEAYNIHVKESGLARNVILDEGVDSTKVIELKKATSTFEEAQEIKRVIDSLHIQNAGILSSEYHMRRVKWTFSRVFGDDEDRLVYICSDSPFYDPNSWWEREEDFLITFSEYTKLLFYFLKY